MNLKFLISAVLSLFVLVNLSGQPEFISADEFMILVKTNKELLILDANKSKNYAASHIKNAIHVNHNDLYKEGDVKGLMLEPTELAAAFGAYGVGDDTEVVICDDGSQKYTSRLYWMLEYLGKKNIKILHKDLDSWRSARIPLTSVATKGKMATLTPVVNPDMNVSLDYVKANVENPDVILVDSRTEEEYNGTSKSEGHLPGAVLMNYEDVLTENGEFLSVEQLKAVAEECGLSPDKELIFYCKTSVRAAVSYIAFKYLLGYDKVKVYDGAYNEWVVENPVMQ